VPGPQTQLELRARVTRLRQLTELRTTQLNQQRLVTNRAVQAGFRKMLAFVAKQIQELEKSIAALIDADPLWRELDQAFRTIKGVADRTVAASWRKCRRSARCPTRPFPNWPVWPRWPKTPANTRANALSAEGAPQYAKSCSSWPALWPS